MPQKTFQLRGLAEGLTGHTNVVATSIEEVYQRFPALATHRDKLTVNGDTIKGFAPCDG